MDRSYILSELEKYKQNKENIENIGIFGSFAREEATDRSDIDICIKTKVPDMFLLVHIRDELEKIFQKKVDIVRVRDRMNPYLKKRIEKEAIYV